MIRLGLWFRSVRRVTSYFARISRDALKLFGRQAHGRDGVEGDFSCNDLQLPGLPRDERQVRRGRTCGFRAAARESPEVPGGSARKAVHECDEENALRLKDPDRGQLKQMTFVVSAASAGSRPVDKSGRAIKRMFRSFRDSPT